MINIKSMLYLDMDGVVADFEGWSTAVIGTDWKTHINKPSWGTYTQHPEMYLRLSPMDKAKELYEFCCDFMGDYNRVQFLTALPNRARDSFPHAANHKILWVKEHINKHARVVFGPFAQHKRYHIRFPEDILIDDTEINIKQWNHDCGVGILHSSVEATIAKLNDLDRSKYET